MKRLLIVLFLFASASWAQGCGYPCCDEFSPGFSCTLTSKSCVSDTKDCGLPDGVMCQNNYECFDFCCYEYCGIFQGPWYCDIGNFAAVFPKWERTAMERERQKEHMALPLGLVLHAQYEVYRKLDRPGAKCTYTKHYRKYRNKTHVSHA